MTSAPLDDRDHTGRALRTLELCALHKRSVRLTCPACGHVAVIDAVALWWLFQRRGWEDRLPEAVRRRLYCGPCRKSGELLRPSLIISSEEPVGPQPPYPDQREWRRIVSRYRS